MYNPNSSSAVTGAETLQCMSCRIAARDMCAAHLKKGIVKLESKGSLPMKPLNGAGCPETDGLKLAVVTKLPEAKCWSPMRNPAGGGDQCARTQCSQRRTAQRRDLRKTKRVNSPGTTTINIGRMLAAQCLTSCQTQFHCGLFAATEACGRKFSYDNEGRHSTEKMVRVEDFQAAAR